MRERLDIDNAAAAAVLSRAQSHPLIANLISRACTMRELVDATGMSYSLLSHHLRRLCELGCWRRLKFDPLPRIVPTEN